MTDPVQAQGSSEAAVNAAFSSIRSLLLVLGTVLAGKGLTDTGLYFWVETIAGGIMVVGPAAWSAYLAVSRVWQTREAQRMGVASGLAAGQAGVGAVSPQTLSHSDAAEIVKTYSPEPNLGH